MAGKPREDRDTIKAHSIAVRCTPEEKARITAAAAAQNRSVSLWLLLLAEAEMKKGTEGGRLSRRGDPDTLSGAAVPLSP